MKSSSGENVHDTAPYVDIVGRDSSYGCNNMGTRMLHTKSTSRSVVLPGRPRTHMLLVSTSLMYSSVAVHAHLMRMTSPCTWWRLVTDEYEEEKLEFFPCRD